MKTTQIGKMLSRLEPTNSRHTRRSKGLSSPTVLFKPNIQLKVKKHEFLLNPNNKQMMINLIAETLCAVGITVRHAPADANYLIVRTAIDAATICNVVVVGEDTDLLVLLIFYSKDVVRNELFLTSEPKSNQQFQPSCLIYVICK